MRFLKSNSMFWGNKDQDRKGLGSLCQRVDVKVHPFFFPN